MAPFQNNKHENNKHNNKHNNKPSEAWKRREEFSIYIVNWLNTGCLFLTLIGTVA